MTKEKLGLILEGGGVKGAFQAGVLEVLDEYGVTFDGVAGTSIGAVNASLYVEGGVSAILKMWDDIKAGAITDPEDERLWSIKEQGINREVLATIGKRIVKFRSWLEKSFGKTQTFFEARVHEDVMRASGKQLGVVTYCATDKSPVEALMDEIPEGRLVDYIIASATFPIFPPKEIDGKKYIDGGVYNNLPVNLLARDGYKKMLVIRTNPADKKPKCKLPFPDDADLFFVIPDEELARVMEFTSAKVTELREKGREAARRALECGLKEFLGL